MVAENLHREFSFSLSSRCRAELSIDSINFGSLETPWSSCESQPPHPVPQNWEDKDGHPRALAVSYQLTFIANWNWRGSYAAVGCPALENSGLTAATLYLLAILNMSTMKSALIRSLK